MRPEASEGPVTPGPPSQGYMPATPCVWLYFWSPGRVQPASLLLRPLPNWNPSSTREAGPAGDAVPTPACKMLQCPGRLWAGGGRASLGVWLPPPPHTPPIPFRLSHRETHLFLTLNFQRMDSGPCLVCVALGGLSAYLSLRFLSLGRREGRGPD